MENNWKNKLQEFCQSSGRNLPQYKTIRGGGAAHEPKWKAGIELGGGFKFESRVHLTKKEAEQDVAKKAFLAMSSEFHSSNRRDNFQQSKIMDIQDIDLDQSSSSSTSDSSGSTFEEDNMSDRVQKFFDHANNPHLISSSSSTSSSSLLPQWEEEVLSQSQQRVADRLALTGSGERYSSRSKKNLQRIYLDLDLI